MAFLALRPLLLLCLCLFASVGVLFAQFPFRHFSPDHRSPFALGVENGLSSFPFGHRFSPPSVPSFSVPFGFASSVRPNFASFAFRRPFFPSSVAAPFPSHFVANNFLRDSLFDRDNFQARGCGWEPSQATCVDLLGICKGGCADFSLGGALLRDCRCVPLGYGALLMGG